MQKIPPADQNTRPAAHAHDRSQTEGPGKAPVRRAAIDEGCTGGDDIGNDGKDAQLRGTVRRLHLSVEHLTVQGFCQRAAGRHRHDSGHRQHTGARPGQEQTQEAGKEYRACPH